MQVSAISASRYTIFGNIEKPDENTDSAETHFKTFTSFPLKKSSANADFESIYEWKEFCHSRILSGKVDYMA